MSKNPASTSLPAHKIALGASGLALALIISGCSIGQDPAVPLPEPIETTQPAPTAPTETTPTQTTPTETPSADAITLGHDQRHVITTTDPVNIICSGGGEIEIRVDAAHLTATGTCEEIDIYGSGNRVNAENTDEFEINGNKNVVEIDSIEELSIEGSENHISSGSITNEIEVKGQNNTILYGSGGPEIENEGQQNTITGR